MSLSGQIAVVTGASRGIGRGIALQLGEAGAIVYITGRRPEKSLAATKESMPTLEKTANGRELKANVFRGFGNPKEIRMFFILFNQMRNVVEVHNKMKPFSSATKQLLEITQRGGKGIAIYCDHGNMKEVEELFERINKERSGQLDILVNNAYSAVNTIMENLGTKFYEQAPEVWDEINNVGLRNNYYCCVYASRIMIRNEKGLIVNIGSAGALRYLFNIPYGVGKCALDRMSADMALELKSRRITCVSLWPGAVRTEVIMDLANNGADGSKQVPQMFLSGETTEYPGIAISHLAADPNMISKTGRSLITADLGDEYRFKDVDGRHPPNMRSLSYCLSHIGWKNLANWIPAWIKIPGWVISAGCSRL